MENENITTPETTSATTVTLPKANCPVCQAQVADGALFCSNCGAKISSDAASYTLPEKKKSRKLPIIAGIVVVIIAISAFVMSNINLTPLTPMEEKALEAVVAFEQKEGKIELIRIECETNENVAEGEAVVFIEFRFLGKSTVEKVRYVTTNDTYVVRGRSYTSGTYVENLANNYLSTNMDSLSRGTVEEIDVERIEKAKQ